MKQYPFAVLAGKPPERDEFLQYADMDNKSLITFKGRSYLQIAVEAIMESGIASSILLVGLPPEDVPFDYDPDLVSFLDIEGPHFDKIFLSSKHLLDNPDQYGEIDRVLYLSADMPLMTSKVILDFVAATGDQAAEFYYPVTPLEVAKESMPGVHFNSMNIKDGRFVSGNLMLVDPHMVLKRYDVIKFTSQNRKKFVWGVLRSSPILFFKLIFKRIRMDEVEHLMTKILKVESALVVTDLYQLAFDVDRPEQLDYLRSLEDETR